MHQFSSVQTSKVNILYLHTKGITYIKDTPIYNNIQDWINYMVYFLVGKHQKCLELLDTNDTVGLNFHSDPHPHWSGNYWWATTDHIKRLDISKLVEKHDAEWWCLSIPDVKTDELYNSGVNHYHESYKPNKYV